jgi:hypothetical protein
VGQLVRGGRAAFGRAVEVKVLSVVLHGEWKYRRVPKQGRLDRYTNCSTIAMEHGRLWVALKDLCRKILMSG